MSMALVSDGNHLVTPDWETKGLVLCIPGSTMSGYQGLGTLSRTADMVILATRVGIEAAVLLTDIEDISVVKFEGIVIERNTSIGPMLSPLPYPHGIEIIHTKETRVKLRLRLITLSGNAAHAWASDIRSAAQQVQLGVLRDMMPIKRRQEIK